MSGSERYLRRLMDKMCWKLAIRGQGLKHRDLQDNPGEGWQCSIKGQRWRRGDVAGFQYILKVGPRGFSRGLAVGCE